MVLKSEVVERRLEELDWTLERLARHRDVDADAYASDPDLQWIVERGLLNAAGPVFDVADHVLSRATSVTIRRRTRAVWTASIRRA